MADAETWALALFRRSVLKQRKLAAIVEMLGPTDSLRCLDLGSDNGVVSLLLRRRGGRWASADLTPEAVASIRELVRDDVHQIEKDARLPFPDLLLDLVAAEPGSGLGDSGVLAQGTKLAFDRMITQSRRVRTATSIYPLAKGIRPSSREISQTAG